MNEEPKNQPSKDEDSPQDEKLQEFHHELEKRKVDWDEIEQIVKTAAEEEAAAKRAAKWQRHYIYLRIFQYLCYCGMFAAGVVIFKFTQEWNFKSIAVIFGGLICFWLSVSVEYSLRISFPEKYDTDDK